VKCYDDDYWGDGGYGPTDDISCCEHCNMYLADWVRDNAWQIIYNRSMINENGRLVQEFKVRATLEEITKMVNQISEENSIHFNLSDKDYNSNYIPPFSQNPNGDWVRLPDGECVYMVNGIANGFLPCD
tara:strand:- start:127 stop:513 length:387 start_codon:yes stop_codon:yes gene_type:complete